MKYIMKAGTLYFNDIVAARIKGAITGSEKKIYSVNGSVLMYANIENLEVPPNETRNVRCRQYILFDGNGNKYAVANPDYAAGDDPTVVGWPLCRMPRVDHAKVVFDKNEYLLIMRNTKNYILSDKFDKAVIQIFHRGLTGGWNIEVMNDFLPEMICGIFVFCKYIEQENEFLLV